VWQRTGVLLIISTSDRLFRPSSGRAGRLGLARPFLSRILSPALPHRRL